MKAKFSLAAVALACGVALAFAAEKKSADKPTDACTVAYEKCSQTCENEKANCRARGSDEGACDKRFTTCENACRKTFNECQQKAGGKKT